MFINDKRAIEEMMISERRAYQNKWRREHKQRVIEYNKTYWRKRAEKALIEISQKENAIREAN